MCCGCLIYIDNWWLFVNGQSCLSRAQLIKSCAIIKWVVTRCCSRHVSLHSSLLLLYNSSQYQCHLSSIFFYPSLPPSVQVHAVYTRPYYPYIVYDQHPNYLLLTIISFNIISLYHHRLAVIIITVSLFLASTCDPK